MLKGMTLKKIVAVIKLAVFLTWYWPLPRNATKCKIICVGLYHYLWVILFMSLIVGLINAIRNHLDDPLIVTKSITFILPAAHIICNILIYRAIAYRLQLVTLELENFCESLQPHEDAAVQQYISKCIYFYGGCIFWFYFAGFVIITGPITLDQSFPTTAEYSFDIYRQPLRSIIYVHQSIIMLQISAQTSFNVLISLLLWFTSVRFELLVNELRATTDIHGLIECIRKHQKLLKFAEEVATVACPFALSNITFSTTALITVGLILISNQPLSMKLEYIGYIFTGLSEVFIYTWPAEHLIHISREIGQAAFDTQWYNSKQLGPLRKVLQMIMSRAQKPIVVAIPCVMPSLSLSYYASYLSTMFSSFTTLRVIMQN